MPDGDATAFAKSASAIFKAVIRRGDRLPVSDVADHTSPMQVSDRAL